MVTDDRTLLTRRRAAEIAELTNTEPDPLIGADDTTP